MRIEYDVEVIRTELSETKGGSYRGRPAKFGPQIHGTTPEPQDPQCFLRYSSLGIYFSHVVPCEGEDHSL